MPIKKDSTGKRWVEMELLVPGTPEQVWQAVATGAGNAAWFVNADIEPRVGGVLRFDFGQGAVSAGEVTEWQPPHKLGYVERDWAPGAPPCATEITIVGRSGDRCVLRMVHSLFTSSDEWDDQVEGFESGWPGFFVVLRIYLAHFAGANAVSFIATTPLATGPHEAYKRLGELLGTAGANVGDRITDAAGPERWSGVVEHVYQDAKQQYVALRLDAPVPGVALVGTSANGPSSSVGLCRYYYGANIAGVAAEHEQRWRDWLARTFGTNAAG
jgi:uncharacterized protein YndB with AHSA1/START domain